MLSDGRQWKERWLGKERWYIVAKTDQLPRFEGLVGKAALFTVAQSGGKVLLTNRSE